MNELERLEGMLRARPASLSNEQRRAAYEALGDLFPLQRMCVLNRWERTAFPLNGRPRLSRAPAK